MVGDSITQLFRLQSKDRLNHRLRKSHRSLSRETRQLSPHGTEPTTPMEGFEATVAGERAEGAEVTDRGPTPEAVATRVAFGKFTEKSSDSEES